ncbi:MAG: hypothetical protein U0271_34050 [Polyangiaceae bacterium]
MKSWISQSASQIHVRYCLNNAASVPYSAFIALGGWGQLDLIQIDIIPGVVILKKQAPAACEVDAGHDLPPVLDARPYELAAGAEHCEEFDVPLPLVANYEPRALELLSNAREEGLHLDGKWVETPAIAPVTVHSVAIAIGVSKDTRPEHQEVLYNVHDLDRPVAARAYEIVLRSNGSSR